jgi:Mn-containing catalase
MYHHVKKLMYTVRVGQPDPRFGRMLLEQFGGANGEMGEDARGPWNQGDGWQYVEAPAFRDLAQSIKK